jgi:hypothetical protein
MAAKGWTGPGRATPRFMMRGLERGEISLMVRPRARDGIERLVLILSPEGQLRHRTIAVARKRPDRFWGFVDRVVDEPRGGDGVYELSSRDGLAHLYYNVDGESAEYSVLVANPDPYAWGLREAPPIQHDLFEKDEVHARLPALLTPQLQQRFGGRRFVALDTVEFLDHPGTELVFSGQRLIAGPALRILRETA